MRGPTFQTVLWLRSERRKPRVRLDENQPDAGVQSITQSLLYKYKKALSMLMNSLEG